MAADLQLKDVDAVFPLTEMVGYEQTIQISEDLSCRFQNAGHILDLYY